MIEPLIDVFPQWMRGRFEPRNQRQLKILETWHAFLMDHPSDFDAMVNTIPDALEVCWQLSLKS